MAWSCLPGILGIPGYSRCDCWNHHAYIIRSCSRILSDEDIFSGMSPLCSTELGIGNPCMMFQDRVDLRIWENVGGRFCVDSLSTYRQLIGSER